MTDEDWYYAEVSEAKCSCGEKLWGQDWWDGWDDDDTRPEVECDACGKVWCCEIEHQEPRLVGREELRR